MFDKVVLNRDSFSAGQRRFASVLNLIANQYHDTAVFYINRDWSAEQLRAQLQPQVESLLAASSHLPDSDPFRKKVLSILNELGESDTLDREQPKLVYMLPEEYESRGDESLPIHVPEDEFIYAPHADSIVARAMEQKGLRSSTAVLILAAAGIEIALPNVCFENTEADEFNEIKEILSEERTAYLTAITSMADEAYGRLVGEEFDDIYEWAANEARFKIVPSVVHLEKKTSMLNRSLLRRAKLCFWQEGVPAIGAALSEDKSITKTLAVTMISLLSSSLAKSIEERQAPEATYILKASKLQRGDA